MKQEIFKALDKQVGQDLIVAATIVREWAMRTYGITKQEFGVICLEWWLS